MAITEKNFHLNTIGEIVEEGEESYQEIIQNRSKIEVLEDLCTQIESLIKQIQTQELNMISGIDGITDIEDFIAAYKEASQRLGVDALTGTQLKKAFIDGFDKKLKGIAKEQKKQQELFGQKLLKELVKGLKNNKLSIDEASLQKEFLLILSGAEMQAIFDFNNGEIYQAPNTFKHIKNQIIKFEDDGPKLIYENLSKTMKTRLDFLMNNRNFLTPFTLLDKYGISKIELLNDTIEVTVNSEWFELTSLDGVAQKESDIRELKEKDPVLHDQLLNSAKEGVMNLILSHVKDVSFVKDRINEILAENEYAFFVGGTSKQITGLLGEISAYAVLSDLFGKQAALKWTAQERFDGKELSIDIVLNELFGIQVKNTTNDLRDVENFAEQGLGARIGFLDESKTAIRDLFGDAIDNLFDTSYFNVSYIIQSKQSPHIVPGSNADFDGLAKTLVSLRENIRDLLLLYSPQLIYLVNNSPIQQQLATLSNELKSKSVKGNILYIVGGQPVFASQMLTKILTQIKNIKELFHRGDSLDKISGALSVRIKGGSTIIEYLNNYSAGGGLIGLDDQGNLGKDYYTKTTVTTSFGF